MKTKWYADGEYLGEMPTSLMFTKGRCHPPYSIVYVCQKCGDAWGKIEVTDPNSRWIPISRLCPRHGPGVLGQYNDDVYELPADAGIREIKLMSKCEDYQIHLITGGR